MTESIIVNRLTEKARREERILMRRETVLEAAQARFPDVIPVEIVDLIRRQDSEELLREWHRAAITAASAEEFLAVVRQ
jgi:hypothetical protein